MRGHQLQFGRASFDSTDPQIDYQPLGAAYFALLQAFVEDTFKSCSFHHDRLSKAGLRDGRVTSFEHFSTLPLLGPGEVNAIPDANLLPDAYAARARTGLADYREEDRIGRKFLTTSSTGTPKGSYYTRSDWATATRFGSRLMGEVPLRRFSRLFNCFHAGHVAGKLFEDIFTSAGCVVENNHHINTNIEAIIRQLGSGLSALGGFNAIALPPWRPPELAGNKGATLDMLLNEDVDNVIGSQIDVIITGGAPFHPESHIKERVWEGNDLAHQPHCTFVHTYGSAEVGIIAVDCPADEGLHLIQGFIFTEVINETTGEPAKNGEPGLVTLTGLKHGSRYLRYIVGDEAIYINEPCRCGRVSPRLYNIQRVLEKERLMAGCAAGGY
jgi:phenylacetate-CoA ligase